MKRNKKGIILPSLDVDCIERAFQFIEKEAPHLTCGMLRYRNNPEFVKNYLKSYEIPSLSWYEDSDFLYWGHEKFTQINWSTFLGEL